jgi:hypothetical protein
MQRQLVEDLHRYFSALEQRSAEEESLWLRITVALPYFDVTSVHRDDLEWVGLNASDVTDGQMEAIAMKMADNYCEQMFWDSLLTIAHYEGVPDKQTNSINPLQQHDYV